MRVLLNRRATDDLRRALLAALGIAGGRHNEAARFGIRVFGNAADGAAAGASATALARS